MSNKHKRIGLFGGVFDPVHCGHLSAAVMAKESFGLEQFFFIPSGTPPHKPSSVTASCDDRLNMLKLALDDLGDWRGCRLGIWDGEIRRGGHSYTIDTLNELDNNGICSGAEVYFIIGADNLADICNWRSYEDIIRRVTLCVTGRPGYGLERPAALASARIETFPGPEWGVSSTMLREYLKSGRSCKYLIPDAVIEYIRGKGLYGSGGGGAHGR